MTNLNALRALFPHADRDELWALARMIDREQRIDAMDMAMRAMTWAEGMMPVPDIGARESILNLSATAGPLG